MLEISLLLLKTARIHKVRRLKPVLYDSLKPIETCTAWAQNTRKISDSFKCTCVMFHKIIYCLQKKKFCLISMLFVLEKCASVNIVTLTHSTYLRIVQFQKISILPPRKGLEIPGGWGVPKNQNI